MLNNFIYAKTKDLFLKELEAGNVLDEAIVFIEDTKEIWNHGTYFANNTLNINYSDLVTLRNNSQLVPGMFYRITDYVTTTSQGNTASAGHQFDIIVQALNESTLSENAKACLNDNDEYFSEYGAKLEAWELKYCLDNDSSRFGWVDIINTVDSTNVHINPDLITDKVFNEAFKPVYYIYVDSTKVEYKNDDYFIEWGRDTSPEGVENQLCIYKNDLGDEESSDRYEEADYTDKFFYWGIEIIDGVEYDKWRKSEEQSWEFINSEEGVYILTLRLTIGEASILSTVLPGVIYYMKDEFNNECPYDFKNIMFNYDGTYYYTFSFINDDDYIEDLTLRQDLTSDEYFCYGTHHNIIKPYYLESDILTQSLNNNIFILLNDYQHEYYGCYNNIFNTNCHNNIIHCCSGFYSNTFKDNCYSNTFGNDCYSNTFGYDCYSNKFGDDCNSNKFESGCRYNTFGNECEYNTFGNNCSSNTFGNDCYSNTFGDECCSNNFGDDCNSNKFGYGCCSNTFGNECYSNTFGDRCDTNTFVGSCSTNTFGNGCDFNKFGATCVSNTFGNRCHSNIFGFNCFRNTLGCGCHENTFGDNCKSNNFEDSCGSNTFGNKYESNTFGDSCSNNTFGDDCYSNTFGNSCKSNILGDNCDSNIFENECCNNIFGDSCHNNSFGYYCSDNTFGQDCQWNKFKFNCYSNTFTLECQDNTFGSDCYNNTFGECCYNNTFKDGCYKNTFGIGCHYNTFGNCCRYIVIVSDYSEYNLEGEYALNNINYLKLGGDCLNLCLFTDSAGSTDEHTLLHVTIQSGVKGSSANTPLVIDLAEHLDKNYELKIAYNSKGELKQYCEADLIG